LTPTFFKIFEARKVILAQWEPLVQGVTEVSRVTPERRGQKAILDKRGFPAPEESRDLRVIEVKKARRANVAKR
jgi:hypothetical protein